MDDTIMVAAMDSAEIDLVRSPPRVLSLSPSGHESGEVDSIRRTEEHRLQRERLLQQQHQQQLATGLEGLSSGERAALLGVNKRKVSVGVKLSDWIWERAYESHRVNTESGEFVQEYGEDRAAGGGGGSVTEGGPQGDIFPMLRFYSSYEEMRRSGKKFILLCLKNDSFRAIVLSYLHAFIVEMKKASALNTAVSTTRNLPLGEWEATPERIDASSSSTSSYDEDVSKAKEEQVDDDLLNSGDALLAQQQLDNWGVIEVEDIYDDNFLQLLAHMEEGQKRSEAESSGYMSSSGGGDDAPPGKSKESEEDANPSSTTNYRPRFDAVVMDLGFYEHLEDEYGTAERKSSPSLQYLRSLIFQGGSGVMARRLDSPGGKGKKSSTNQRKRSTGGSPTSTRWSTPSSSSTAANGSETNAAPKRQSPDEARYTRTAHAHERRPANHSSYDNTRHMTRAGSAGFDLRTDWWSRGLSSCSFRPCWRRPRSPTCLRTRGSMGRSRPPLRRTSSSTFPLLLALPRVRWCSRTHALAYTGMYLGICSTGRGGGWRVRGERAAPKDHGSRPGGAASRRTSSSSGCVGGSHTRCLKHESSDQVHTLHCAHISTRARSDSALTKAERLIHSANRIRI
jgi:hypothetical protein